MFKVFDDDFGINLDEILITVPVKSMLAEQLIETAKKENKIVNCCRGKKRVTVALLKDCITVLILPIKVN